MKLELSKVSLFEGIAEKDISALLQCLGAVEKTYKKGTAILKEGSTTEQLGVVLQGQILVQCTDVWGDTVVLGSAGEGAVFGEVYACCPEEALQSSVVAAEDTQVLLLNVNRILTICHHTCRYHTQLVRNLLTISARQNLDLSRRIFHTKPKTIRSRLLSYFAECAKRERSKVFELKYNRQQLADHLGVDRSAMCNELSKMQRDGLIRYGGRKIEINEQMER